MQPKAFWALAVLAGTWGGASLAQSPGAEADATDARRRQAAELEERLHAAALEWEPEGWSHERTERFLVLHQDSPKHAESFSDQGEAVLAWLDDTLPYVGPESYVRSPILRIAKTYDELAKLRRDVGEKSWRGVDLDILCCRGNYGAASGEIDIVNQRVLQIWFNDRDADLYKWLPRWVSQGLRDVIADSREKRGKLVFKEDDRDRERLRDAERDGGGLIPLRELVLLESSDFDDEPTAYAQSGVLIEFLVSKDASRKPFTRDLLKTYLQNLTATLDALEASGEKREERVLDEAFERTFRGWTDKDWEAFEKAVKKRL